MTTPWKNGFYRTKQYPSLLYLVDGENFTLVPASGTPSNIDNVANRLRTITDKSALILHSEMTRPVLPLKVKRGQSDKRKGLKIQKSSS